MKQLPDSWILTTVQDLYKVIGGGTPSTKEEHYWQGNYPWITSADIYGLKNIQPRRNINNEAIANSSTNLVSANSILVVTRVGLGKIAITDYQICFNQDIQALIDDSALLNQYYSVYCLSEAVKEFTYKSRGTTISGVTKKQLLELNLPLPPLNEQTRIVDKIEELFTELDKGVATLKELKQQIKRYRQSVLKHAFEGKLTEKWREENKGGF